MGGIWGISSSTSLESLPPVLRGLGSGIVQQGYAVGYLIAASINLSLVENLDSGAEARGGGSGWLREGEAWRALFFVAAGVSAGVAILRVFLPESEVFERAKLREEDGDGKKKSRTFVKETGRMMRLHWRRWVYAVLLMSGEFQLPFIPVNSIPSSCTSLYLAPVLLSTVIILLSCDLYIERFLSHGRLGLIPRPT
jgi:SHS family lactate transporter-like MFS transporter